MKKKFIGISVAIILIGMLIVLSLFKVLNLGSKNLHLSREDSLAMTYGTLTNSDIKVANCENVEFSAFFTRDLNNDGYAEKIKGTCKELNKTDTLYVDIGVLGGGSLINGEIILNAENFTWTTSLVQDNIIDGDYIGETKYIKLKNVLLSGSEKLIMGTIKSDLHNNINNFSKVSSVTLKGTFVNNDGEETEINETREITVDWYGDTKTIVNKYYINSSSYTSYDSQILDIKALLTYRGMEINFKTAISEIKRVLPLQKQVEEITIPKLKGYEPISVEVLDKNVTYDYNKSTRKLTITRESVVDDDGNFLTQIAQSNVNNVRIVYPKEVYDKLTADSIALNLPVVGYNFGYNNSNGEFQAIHKSRNEGILTLTYSKPNGEDIIFGSTIGEKKAFSNRNEAFRYEVSKEAVEKIYNGNNYSDEKTIYPVEWDVTLKKIEGISKVTIEPKKENGTIAYDEFLNTQGEYINLYDYVETTGIYFENATAFLGEDGWIKLYNEENGSLIDTFESNVWESYTSENPYNVSLKAIKIETSEPVSTTNLKIYQLKELNYEMVSQDFSKEEFDKLNYIYTYAQLRIDAKEDITFENGSTFKKLSHISKAYYDIPYSVSILTVDPKKIGNQKTENIDFTISTVSASDFEAKWKNGVFLIELPDNIIKADIKNIIVTDPNVKILSSEVYESEEKLFIKLYTSNEEETIYAIQVNADITANPMTSTLNKVINLYSYNENGDYYFNKSLDKYDVDSDGTKTDNIGFDSIDFDVIAPSGVLTTEYITDYDELGSITIAPNIAEINKTVGDRTAIINVSITNNYSGTISGTKILGKVPFENNTFVLTSQNLNSQYTANMTGPIVVPDAIKNKVKIYYSTKNNTNENIKDSTNEWKLEKDVSNWNEIKTYLIDFQTYKLAKNESEVFKYEVKVPGGLGYNKASYSTHAVFYNLDTEHGKLATKMETNKVGIHVVSKYGLQLTKNKIGFDSMLVKGAIYSAEAYDLAGNIVTKTAVTDENGILNFEDLYIDREYTLKEISAPEDYVVDENEVKFKAELDESDKLTFNVLEGNLKGIPQIELDSNNNYLVKANIEDDTKYTLVINKSDYDNNELSEVKFSLEGKGKPEQTYRTDENGKIVITGLYKDANYKLQEIKADGFYVDSTVREFSITRNSEKELEIVSDDNIFKNVVITETDGIEQAEVSIDIKNEKIPTYSLRVLKIEEIKNEGDELKPLGGACFKLVNEDTGAQREYVAGDDGYLTIPDLYQYIGEKETDCERYYTLQETKAPDGYANNAEKIKFRVVKQEDGSFELDLLNNGSSTSLNSVTLENNVVTMVIEDKPLFKIIKVDSETGERLPNASFVIYEMDTDEECYLDYVILYSVIYDPNQFINPESIYRGNSSGSERYVDSNRIVDYAKDVNDEYVGQQDSTGRWLVTTDENGEIILPLQGGNYCIKEVIYPENYKEDHVGTFFQVPESRKDIEINYIEDLVDLSNKVNRGKMYKNTTIRLMRTLDFNDNNSYKNASSTEYGDLNQNGVVEDLKTELTSTNGTGFTPIGKNHNRTFGGVFDGQDYEIRNIYENVDSSKETTLGGLFGYVKGGRIKNLGITGNIVGSGNYIGGIAGYVSDGYVSNVHNSATISGTASSVAGCIGNIYKSTIVNSYNTGSVTGTAQDVGGICGKASTNSEIINCYNRGTIQNKITNSVAYTGGIVAYSNYSTIKCSHNSGKVINTSANSSNYVAGIAGMFFGGKCEDCYNTQEINAHSTTYSYVGGIVGYAYSNAEVANCYNSGKIVGYGDSEAEVGGIVGFGYSDLTIRKCYNTGTIGDSTTTKGTIWVGGIAGIHYTGTLEECYNKGNITVKSNQYVLLGGVVGGLRQDGNVTVNNCYNTGNLSGTITNTGTCWNYTGGVVGYCGQNCTSVIKNCYNVGNLTSSQYVGRVVALIYTSSTTTISNCYYSSSVTQVGTNKTNTGTSQTQSAMKTTSFYNKINVDKVWTEVPNDYPTLSIVVKDEEDVQEPELPVVETKAQELTIENTIKKFYVDMRVVSHNETNEVDGLLVSSLVPGGYIEDNGTWSEDGLWMSKQIKVHNLDKEEMGVKIVPDDNYAIISIKINGVEYPFKAEEDGTFTIPDEYFDSIEDNICITAKFEKLSNILTVHKVDEDDAEKKLAGAKFTVTINGEQTQYTTDEDGEFKLVAPSHAVVEIEETQAPEGYTLNSTVIPHTMDPNGNNVETITNKEQGEIIVHHYYKDENGEYTTKKVAEDDSIRGDIGNNYSTSPKVDLPNLALEKEDGKYKIPTNATGIFGEEPIEVSYYYEAQPVELTINHYIIGTTKKIAEEKKEYYDSKITFDEDNNYTASAQGLYEVNSNADYAGLLEEYELERIDTTESPEINIDDVIEVTKNMELRYYYHQKDLYIVTEVKTHTENRTNKLTNEKEDLEIEGGTISGKGEDPYEIVRYGEDSIKEYKVVPNEKYLVRQITLIATDKEEEEPTVLYGLQRGSTDENCVENVDGSITINNLTNITENKKIAVEFMPEQSSVVIHHILVGETEDHETETKTDIIGEPYVTDSINITGYKLVETSENYSGIFTAETIDVFYYYDKADFEYTTEYYYDGEKRDSKTDTAKFEEEIRIYEDRNITGYKLEKTENLPLIISAIPENNVIKVYYVKDEFDYTVEYYYDGEKKDEKTEKALYGDIINTYEDKRIIGYKFEKEENLPLTISEIAENNVIKVYYVKAPLEYKVEYYYDGEKDNSKTATLNATYGDEITTYEDKKITGYKLEKEENLPLTISEEIENNIIKVYYVKDEFEYTVEYYYDGTKDDSKTVTENATYGDKINTYDDKTIPKYKFEKTENLPLTISEITENNVIKVYYIKDKFDYTVEYYYDEEKDESKTVTEAVNLGNIITKYEDKNMTGYKFEKVENLPLTVQDSEDENIIKVYYVRKDSKIVIKYVDENTNEEIETRETISGKVFDEVNIAEKEKAINGYEMVRAPEETAEITEEEQTFTYYYAKSARVIVEYLEKDTNEELEESEIIRGYVGKEYDTSAKEIENYTCVENTNNTSGNMEEDEIIIKYYYLKNTSAKVQYIDQSTGNILYSESKEGVVGDLFETVSKEFKNYILVEEPEDKIIVMQDNEIILKYYYKHVLAGVIEKHLDIKNNTLLYNELHEGEEGDNYNIESKTFEGYDLVKEKLPENSSGTMTSDVIEVKYYYKKKTKVTIQYIDVVTGEKLADDEIIEGHEGDSYRAEELEFEGYDLLEIPDNSEGIMTGEEQIVEYQYKRKTKVIVQYINEETGEKIIDDEIIEGHENDEYTAEPKEIAGYELITTTEDLQGIMSKETTYLKIYYKKVEGSVETPTPTETPDPTDTPDEPEIPVAPDPTDVPTAPDSPDAPTETPRPTDRPNETEIPEQTEVPESANQSTHKSPSTGDRKPIVAVLLLSIAIIINMAFKKINGYKCKH